ncbi:MAG: hypothetical protein Q9210_005304, partial [Variospora velana]
HSCQDPDDSGREYQQGFDDRVGQVYQLFGTISRLPSRPHSSGNVAGAGQTPQAQRDTPSAPASQSMPAMRGPDSHARSHAASSSGSRQRSAAAAAAATTAGGLASHSLPPDHSDPNGRQTPQSHSAPANQLPSEDRCNDAARNDARSYEQPPINDHAEDWYTGSVQGPTLSSENDAQANHSSGGAPKGSAAHASPASQGLFRGDPVLSNARRIPSSHPSNANVAAPANLHQELRRLNSDGTARNASRWPHPASNSDSRGAAVQTSILSSSKNHAEADRGAGALPGPTPMDPRVQFADQRTEAPAFERPRVHPQEPQVQAIRDSEATAYGTTRASDNPSLSRSGGQTEPSPSAYTGRDSCSSATPSVTGFDKLCIEGADGTPTKKMPKPPNIGFQSNVKQHSSLQAYHDCCLRKQSPKAKKDGGDPHGRISFDCDCSLPFASLQRDQSVATPKSLHPPTMAPLSPDDGWVVTVRCLRDPKPTPQEIGWIGNFIRAFNSYRKDRLRGRAPDQYLHIEKELRKDASIVEGPPSDANLRYYWQIQTQLDPHCYWNKPFYIRAQLAPSKYQHAIQWTAQRNGLRNNGVDAFQSALLDLQKLEAQR